MLNKIWTCEVISAGYKEIEDDFEREEKWPISHNSYLQTFTKLTIRENSIFSFYEDILYQFYACIYLNWIWYANLNVSIWNGNGYCPILKSISTFYLKL